MPEVIRLVVAVDGEGGLAVGPDSADRALASARMAYTWAGSAQIRTCWVMLMVGVPSGSC